MSEAEAPFETALAGEHRTLGARMVPFSGWLMPLQYEGILAEHQQTRSQAGLFDLSHMGRLSIEGSDALAFVQHAATNDASKLAAGAAQYSLLCNARGGVIDDILVYRLADGLRLVVNAGNRARAVAHLTQLREGLGLDARLRDDTFATALLGIQGPDSLSVVQPLISEPIDALGYYRFLDTHLVASLGATPVTVARSGYTGEDGFEITVPADRAAELWRKLLEDDRVRPVGLGARDTLRLEAGMPLYGHELGDDTTPFEAGLSRVVKLDKGEFLGRKALAATAETPLSRQLVGISLPAGAVPRQGNQVQLAGTTVGAIASGTFSPTLKRPIATAFVAPSAATPETELRVLVRDSQVPARVVSLPFVPHRTKGTRSPS